MDNYNNQTEYIFDKDCGDPDNYSEIFQLQNKRRDQFGEYNYIKQKNGAECRYYRPDYDFRSWVKKDANGDIVLFHLHDPTKNYVWYIMKRGENKFVKHRDEDDKPAEVTENYKRWYQYGKLHRLNGPSVIQGNKYIFAIEGKQFFNENDFKNALLQYYKTGFEKYEKVYDVLSMMPQELTDLIVDYEDNRISKKELREKIKDLEKEFKDEEEHPVKRLKISEQSTYKPIQLIGNNIQPIVTNTEQRRPMRRFRP
jgi:hypothetical protein